MSRCCDFNPPFVYFYQIRDFDYKNLLNVINERALIRDLKFFNVNCLTIYFCEILNATNIIIVEE